MNKDEIRYCLSKQLPKTNYISTVYGDIHLDDELQEAVKKAIEPILEARLAAEVLKC